MNWKHMSRCGKQTNHFSNFPPQETGGAPFFFFFFFFLPSSSSSPPLRSFLCRCPRFFPALADLIQRSHNSVRPHWTSEQPTFFPFFGGKVGEGSALFFCILEKKPYLVVLAAALKAAGAPQIFILPALGSGCVCLSFTVQSCNTRGRPNQWSEIRAQRSKKDLCSAASPPG